MHSVNACVDNKREDNDNIIEINLIMTPGKCVFIFLHFASDIYLSYTLASILQSAKII